jgi:hypothetical protein
VAAGSPLGPSYILVPLPNDDETLLGRVLLELPERGRSLDEVSRPNECADKLTPKKEGPLASTFEDAQELAAGGKARAALGAFGFEGDAQTATHFYYKLDVSKRVAQSDTVEYVTCCKEKGSCGYGFVSALVYGDGQYATAAESSADGSVSFPLAGGAGGFVQARVLHKRSVHGYVAALVTVTDPKASQAITLLGDPAAAGIALTEQSLPGQVKARFEAEKIVIEERGCTPPLINNGNTCVQPAPGARPTPIEFAYVFKDGTGEITENEFVRRYAALTSLSELDSANHARATWAVVLGAILTPIGAAAFAIGVTRPLTGCNITPMGACPSNDRQMGGAGLGLLIGGGIVGVWGLGTIGVGLAFHDGLPSDHVITKFDADLYAAKYNRALLRRTIRDTDTRMHQISGKNAVPSFTINPVVAPEFTGIVGTF